MLLPPPPPTPTPQVPVSDGFSSLSGAIREYPITASALLAGAAGATAGAAYAGDAGGMHMSAGIDTTGLSGAQQITVRNMGSNGGHTQFVNSDHSGNTKSTYAYLQVHEIED